MDSPQTWRSLLLMPASNERLWRKAHLRGADAIVLDLEDGVGLEDKAAARVMLPEAARHVAHHGLPVVVRINSPWTLALQDLAACAAANLRTIMPAKTETAGKLEALLECFHEQRSASDGDRDPVAFIPLIESAMAIQRLDRIAAAEGVVGLALGAEDFAHSMGVEPQSSVLDLPCGMVALAAAARGLASFATPMGIMAVDRPEDYGKAARRARMMGVTGALCAHPGQVAAVHAAYEISEPELAHARAVLATWVAGGEKGVIPFGTSFIDAPLVLRAQALLARSAQDARRRLG